MGHSHRNPMETTARINIFAKDDKVDDDDEEVLLGFGTSLPAEVSTGTPATSTVTITDDDDPEVKVSFGADQYTAPEGATVSVIVELDADPERSVTIPIMSTPKDGASGADYSVPASVTFESGDTSKGIRFTAAQDDIDDDGESALLAFGAGSAGKRP